MKENLLPLRTYLGSILKVPDFNNFRHLIAKIIHTKQYSCIFLRIRYIQNSPVDEKCNVSRERCMRPKPRYSRGEKPQNPPDRGCIESSVSTAEIKCFVQTRSDTHSYSKTFVRNLIYISITLLTFEIIDYFYIHQYLKRLILTFNYQYLEK